MMGGGINNMDAVVEHEMAHIFGAGDNYYQYGYGGCTSTTELFGYLDIPNSNCEYQNPGADTNVLMNNSNPYRTHWSTQYQVGWRDQDGDSIPDELDTFPGIQVGIDNSNNVVGVIYDIPLQSETYSRGITVNKIVSARFNIDNESWNPITPVDGVFDSDYEPVNFNLVNLSDSDHTLYLEATNSIGNVTTKEIQLTNFFSDVST